MTETPDDSETFTVDLMGEPEKKTPWALILIAIGLGLALMRRSG